jgi:hypothetical protein
MSQALTHFDGVEYDNEKAQPEITKITGISNKKKEAVVLSMMLSQKHP